MEGPDGSSSLCSSHQQLEPQNPALEVSDVPVFILISPEKAGHPFPLPALDPAQGQN